VRLRKKEAEGKQKELDKAEGKQKELDKSGFCVFEIDFKKTNMKVCVCVCVCVCRVCTDVTVLMHLELF
jgi:hypothetical protein